MNTIPTGRPVEILLIDDDAEDVRLTCDGLREARVPSRVTVVKDGDEALAYLRAEGEHAASILPDLVLLDLKMPRKGGLEVLREIKADPMLRRIPVMVLTTSDAPDDILAAYDLQASAYITKPADLEEFQRMIGSFTQFCLAVVKLPPRP